MGLRFTLFFNSTNALRMISLPGRSLRNRGQRRLQKARRLNLRTLSRTLWRRRVCRGLTRARCYGTCIGRETCSRNLQVCIPFLLVELWEVDGRTFLVPTNGILESFVSSEKADIFCCHSVRDGVSISPPYTCAFSNGEGRHYADVTALTKSCAQTQNTERALYWLSPQKMVRFTY